MQKWDIFPCKVGSDATSAHDSAISDKPLSASSNFRKKQISCSNMVTVKLTQLPRIYAQFFLPLSSNCVTLSINPCTSPFRKTAQLLLITYQIFTLNFEGLSFPDIFPSCKAEGGEHTCSSYTYPRVLSALLAGSKPLVNSYLSPCQSRSG